MRQGIGIAVICGLSLASVAGCAPTAPPPAAPSIPRPVPPQSPPVATQARTVISDGLPEGPGKAETLAACSGCHGIGQILSEHRDVAQWSSTVTSMINNGAPVADPDFDKVVSYLAAHFGP